jgi:hypothetical protein
MNTIITTNFKYVGEWTYLLRTSDSKNVLFETKGGTSVVFSRGQLAEIKELVDACLAQWPIETP